MAERGSVEGAPLGLGIVGTGRFAEFCLPAYMELPEVRVIAVADVDVGRAKELAPTGAKVYRTVPSLLEDPAVNIVSISTPPYFHGPQAAMAARAGKHVLVEKPIATTLADAEEALRAAERAGVSITVNYVLRRHPLHELALQITRSGAFGPLHQFTLVNLATDEGLGREHWFWDQEQSGGILVEHGVHFFDLCNQHAGGRPDKVWGCELGRVDGRRDRSGAMVRYGDELLATFYHSFRRPRKAERTTLALGYDLGQVYIEGWIPTRLELSGLTNKSGCELLRALLDDKAQVRVAEDDMYEVCACVHHPDRAGAYRRGVQNVLHELVQEIRGVRRLRITGADALDSLAVALAARS